MRLCGIAPEPGTRTLRQFAALCLVLFGALAVWTLRADGATLKACLFGALALTLGPAGLAAPKVIRPVYRLSMIAAFPVGWVVSHMLLAFVYYAVVTPIAALSRLAGRDQLRLGRRKVETYWIENSEDTDPGSYLRQY